MNRSFYMQCNFDKISTVIVNEYVCSIWRQLYWTSAVKVTSVFADSDIKHFMFTSQVMKLTIAG